MTDISQILPPELLAEILEHVSVSEILTFKQVNRAFRDVILASPLIQHKIDLFAAGFEYNAAARIDLDESRKVLLQYKSSVDSLCPIEERVVDHLREDYDSGRAVGGVHAIVDSDSVLLLALGSASRGIPYKQWEIPLPITDPTDYGFCPRADVFAVIELQDVSDMRIAIHLMTLSSGEPHPAARYPTFNYSRGSAIASGAFFVSITTSRLAVFSQYTNCLVVWDWKSAQVLFELEEERYLEAEFIDDYRLLAVLGATQNEPASLALIDAVHDVEGTPMQTVFLLPPCIGDFQGIHLLLEQGAYEPSPAESLAPFHQDPSQRIAVLYIELAKYYLVLRVGALLEFGDSRGSEIGWDRWKSCVAIPPINLDQLIRSDLWVSGCRLFSVYQWDLNSPVYVEVYDFSVQGRARHLSSWVNEEFGGLKYLSSTGTSVRIPLEGQLQPSSGGHDSLLFPIWVFVEDRDEHQYSLHIWTF